LASLNRAVFWFSPFGLVASRPLWPSCRNLKRLPRRIEVVEDRVFLRRDLLDLMQHASRRQPASKWHGACTVHLRVERISAQPPSARGRVAENGYRTLAVVAPLVIVSAGKPAYRPRGLALLNEGAGGSRRRRARAAARDSTRSAGGGLAVPARG